MINYLTLLSTPFEFERRLAFSEGLSLLVGWLMSSQKVLLCGMTDLKRIVPVVMRLALFVHFWIPEPSLCDEIEQ